MGDPWLFEVVRVPVEGKGLWEESHSLSSKPPSDSPHKSGAQSRASVALRLSDLLDKLLPDVEPRFKPAWDNLFICLCI